MKKNIVLTAVVLTAIGLVLSCAKETPAPEEKPVDPQEEVVTYPSVIKAGIPEEMTKVALSDEGVGNGMSLAWQADDKLRVIATAGGDGNEQFTIKAGYTATTAEFEGDPVVGTQYTVFYPGTYADVDAINARSYTSQIQDGNGSTAHLEWNAIETGVGDYSSVSFSNKQNGALRFKLQLPESFTTVKKVALKASSAIFSTTNAGNVLTDELVLTLKDGSNDYITLGGDKVLTAYMMVSWNDNTIPGDTDLQIEVWGDPELPWVKTKTVASKGYTIAGGKVTNIKLNDENWEEPLFWGGDGTALNPYIIKTAYHLGNVKTVMDANPTTGLYFRLDEDIDLENAVWEQVNQASPHTPYTIYFDGNNHTISNFSIPSNEMGLCSFFGEISGEVKDLAFSTATIVAGGSNGSSGVLCGIANGLTVNNVDATNVDITIVRSPGETTGVGGLIGYAIGSTISNCDLTGCDITIGKKEDVPAEDAQPQNVGGLIGRLREEASSVTDCSVSNATIAARYCAGGLIGKLANTTGSVSVTGNDITNMNVSYKEVESSSSHLSGAGGIVGLVQPSNGVTVSISGSEVSSITINSAALVGGVVGYSSKPVTISDCEVSGSLTATSTVNIATLDYSHVGGIIGFAYNSGCLIEDCDVTANITGVKSAGGIAGRTLGGTVSGCTYKTGTISASERVGGITGTNAGAAGTVSNCEVSNSAKLQNTGQYTGGVIGRNHSSTTGISGCIVNASLEGTSAIGGIVGEAGGAVAVSSCNAQGTIATSAGYTGGIIGINKGSSTISDSCSSSFTITGGSTSYLGGIVGSFDGGGNKTVVTLSITGAEASGSINTTGSNVGGIVGGCVDVTYKENSEEDASPFKQVNITSCTSSVNLGGNQNLGGIIGRARYPLAITLCKTSGTLTSTKSSENSYVGGMVGETQNGTITKSYSTSTISGRKRCGGFIGAVMWGNFEVTESYFNGTITSNASQIGGIAACVSDSKTITISDCYTAGSISCPGGYTGGIVGYLVDKSTLHMSNSYSRMNLSVSANNVHSVGGLVGGADKTTPIWDISKCLAWHSKIDIKTLYDTVGVIAGQIHNDTSSASTSLSNCWYAYDLDCTFGNGRALKDDDDADHTVRRAYDGKRADEGVSCSTKASNLSWDGTTIWDLTSGDYPALLRVVE